MSDATTSTNADANDASLLASILQPLVASGFVRVAEIGTLAQVSKCMQQATLDEALLCHCNYPDVADLPAEVKESKERGYRWRYKRRTIPGPKKRPCRRSLAPPSCREEDLFRQCLYYL